MKPFIDIPGASGRSYRFRLWEPDAAQVPAAGNWATVRFKGERAEIVKLGMSDNLARIPSSLMTRRQASPSYLYIRLNISRAAREAEQDDLVAAHAQATKRRKT